MGLRKEIKRIVASISCTQYGHVVKAAIRIKEGHPVEVLLLPEDLVYQQAEVSHPEDLQDDL